MVIGELRYDAEFLAAITALNSIVPEPRTNVSELRHSINDAMRAIHHAKSWPKHVDKTRIPFISYDGAEVAIYRFASREMVASSTPQPAAVYIHGGGMVCGSVNIYAPTMAYLADAVGMPFFAIDYRLAPEHPGPNLAKEVYWGLKHLSDHAAGLNIDSARICIMGDSGGGGIAASAALIARDRGLNPPVAKQLLLYPMLDDRTQLAADSTLRQFLTWSENDNRIAWEAVLGKERAGRKGSEASIYSVPGRAEDLRGLPSTYIDIGGLDLFCSESIAYASRLVAAGVEVEFHVWPGVPHGFEEISPQISWATKAEEARKSALRRV
ncbi:Alpha/Beta hydrolase protein [Ilyonectria sp. MPI-CAGE-AT-0026]|nr:Alpha/Beta hydrolase protein [Ilyonectria sp. MPI-CAGE-AT-0026]